MSSRSESKWFPILPIIVAAAIGIALMFVLAHVLREAVLSVTTIGGMQVMVWGGAAGCYFITGLIAGAWARQRGAGVSAAIVLWLGNLIYSLSNGGLASYEGDIVTDFLVSTVFAIAIGLVGGFVGEKIRK